MITFIVFVVLIVLSFVAGGLTVGYFRQQDIDGLRNDLALSRDREARLEEELRLKLGASGVLPTAWMGQ